MIQSSDRALIDRWFGLYGLLDDKAAKSAMHDLAQRISAGGYVGNLLAIIRRGQTELLKTRGFGRDGVVRSIIIPLLSTDDGRRWIQSNSTILRASVKSSSRDAAASLKVELDRLQRSPRRSRNEDAPKLRRLLFS